MFAVDILIWHDDIFSNYIDQTENVLLLTKSDT